MNVSEYIVVLYTLLCLCNFIKTKFRHLLEIITNNPLSYKEKRNTEKNTK